MNHKQNLKEVLRLRSWVTVPNTNAHPTRNERNFEIVKCHHHFFLSIYMYYLFKHLLSCRKHLVDTTCLEKWNCQVSWSRNAVKNYWNIKRNHRPKKLEDLGMRIKLRNLNWAYKAWEDSEDVECQDCVQFLNMVYNWQPQQIIKQKFSTWV